MILKKGKQVEIICGKDKGKKGDIISYNSNCLKSVKIDVRSADGNHSIGNGL